MSYYSSIPSSLFHIVMSEQQQTPKRVAIYIRVSTDEQVEKYGKDLQRSAIDALIASRANTPQPFVFAGEDHVYCDDGISGTVKAEERPAFARLKEAVELAPPDNRPFDAVAVYRIDRLARKLVVLLSIIDFFQDNELEFLSVNESIDTSTPFGRAMLSFIGVIAELERETIVQRTQAGKEQALKQGRVMGRIPPYGYRKDNEGHLVIFEEEAAVIRDMFDMVASRRMTVGDVTTYLRENEVFSPEASAVIQKGVKKNIRKNNTVHHWRPEVVRKVLTDEVYIGKIYYHKSKNSKPLPKKEWKEADQRAPQIVSDLVFEMTQRNLKRFKHEGQGRSKESLYPLSGLLVCDACSVGDTRNHWVGTGKTLKKGKKKRVRYYHCGHKNTGKYDSTCLVLPLPADEIEQYILNKCKEILRNPEAVMKHQRKLQSSRVEMKQLEKRESEILKLANGLPARRDRLREQHELGVIDGRRLKEQMDELTNSERKYHAALNEIERTRSQVSLSEGYIRTLDLFVKKYQNVLENIEKDTQMLYDLFHLLIEEVVVYSRPVTEEDKVAGRKKEGQLLPYRIHIKLRLPQDMLRELAKQPVIITETLPASDDTGSVSSRQKPHEGGDGGNRTRVHRRFFEMIYKCSLFYCRSIFRRAGLNKQNLPFLAPSVSTSMVVRPY